jgi:hypothetical protein
MDLDEQAAKGPAAANASDACRGGAPRLHYLLKSPGRLPLGILGTGPSAATSHRPGESRGTAGVSSHGRFDATFGMGDSQPWRAQNPDGGARDNNT